MPTRIVSAPISRDELRTIAEQLELLDLTLDDLRWRHRLLEIARARELLCAATLLGGGEYGTSLEDLDQYFLAFAVAARNARAHSPL